jgi:hypothetical protein
MILHVFIKSLDLKIFYAEYIGYQGKHGTVPNFLFILIRYRYVLIIFKFWPWI